MIVDVRAKIFYHWFFSEKFTIEKWYSDVRNVKKWGVTDFVLERTFPEEHLNLTVNRALLAKKVSVDASPKILQLELWREMFSAKYLLGEFSQLARFSLKEQVSQFHSPCSRMIWQDSIYRG